MGDLVHYENYTISCVTITNDIPHYVPIVYIIVNLFLSDNSVFFQQSDTKPLYKNIAVI